MTTLAINDIVTWTTRIGSWSSRTDFGIVTHVTEKGGVTARYLNRQLKPHGEPINWRANARGIPKKASDLELARLRWLAERPQVVGATMRFRFGANDADPPDGACVDDSRLKSPDALRATAADLIKLAEWWEREPKAETLASAVSKDH